MPWTLSDMTSKQKALLYALIDLQVENAEKIAKSKE